MYLISKDHLPLEEILDNSNNKLASTRFVSSISSTTSSALKYDESPQIDQPSSFHTFDFYYGRLVVRLHLLQSKLLVSNEYCNTFTTTTILEKQVIINVLKVFFVFFQYSLIVIK
ncbi:unnamed protein product [Rotaria magnacalcarata]